MLSYDIPKLIAYFSGHTALSFFEHGIITHDANVHEAGIELGGDIIEGKFVDIDKPTFMEFRAKGLAKALGARTDGRTRS